MSEIIASIQKTLDDTIIDNKYLLSNFSKYLDFNPEINYAISTIAFNPIFWNIVARLEFKTKFITKLTKLSYRGCYLLAFTIFSLGIYRDHIYHNALLNQPTYEPWTKNPIIGALAILTFSFGNILVLSSMYMLGVTGTYLGDYFGILMEDRVTGFPFNINDNPMYNGSTLCFLGTALWFGKPMGVLISLFVFGMYKIALLFEEPFTAKIYANRELYENKKNE